MVDTLLCRAQPYEPQEDESPEAPTFPLGLIQPRGAPRVSNAPGSTTSSRQRVDTREYRQRRPALWQEPYEDLLAVIIRDGKLEFEAQQAQITKLTDALLALAKTITDQQAAHKIIYDGAKATYDEHTTFRQQVKDEIAALKGEATGQKEAVETLSGKIKPELVIQWEALIKSMKRKTTRLLGQRKLSSIKSRPICRAFMTGVRRLSSKNKMIGLRAVKTIRSRSRLQTEPPPLLSESLKTSKTPRVSAREESQPI